MKSTVSAFIKADGVHPCRSVVKTAVESPAVTDRALHGFVAKIENRIQLLRPVRFRRRLFLRPFQLEMATEQRLDFRETLGSGAIAFVHRDHEAAAGTRPGEEVLDVSIAQARRNVLQAAGVDDHIKGGKKGRTNTVRL